MAKKIVSGVLLLVLGAALVGACGASSMPKLTGYQPAGAPPLATAVVERLALSETSSASGGSTEDSAVHQAEVQPMIIWTAQIALTVEDATQGMEQVQSIARSLGGYTVSTESWLSGDQLHARLMVRVPADKFDAAMAQLRGLAIKVTSESANSEDVTDQYVDLESRLRALEAKETQLSKFLDQAEDTDAVLAVYSQLSETQSEIEQAKGRMSYLEKLSAMATITAELTPKLAELPVVEEGWKPLRTLRNAARSLVSTLQGLANALIWFVIYALPVLVLIALPIVIVIWIIRRLRHSRRKASA